MKIFKERENKDDNNNNLIPIILITLLLINKGFNEYKSQFECVGKILILSSIKLQDNQNEIYLETMVFFRSWFFKILINNLNIDNLMTIEEIKIIESWNYEDFKILKKLQIIWLPNDKQNDINIGYNIIYGFTNNLSKLLIKLLYLIKKREIDGYNEIKLFEIISILNKLENEDIKNFLILINSCYLNDEFQFDINNGIPEEMIEKIHFNNNEKEFISWLDISYQCNRLIIIFEILKEFLLLKDDNYLINQIISEIFNNLRFLKSIENEDGKIKSKSLILFKNGIYNIGKFIKDNERQKLVKSYFNNLINFGDFNSIEILKELEDKWNDDDIKNDELFSI